MAAAKRTLPFKNQQDAYTMGYIQGANALLMRLCHRTPPDQFPADALREEFYAVLKSAEADAAEMCAARLRPRKGDKP